jgi:hypothetical protein
MKILNLLETNKSLCLNFEAINEDDFQLAIKIFTLLVSDSFSVFIDFDETIKNYPSQTCFTFYYEIKKGVLIGIFQPSPQKIYNI